jgi:hypothetical protein
VTFLFWEVVKLSLWDYRKICNSKILQQLISLTISVDLERNFADLLDETHP